MYALADYNDYNDQLLMLSKSISDVYIYLSEGVTEASRARSDTNLPIGYMIHLPTTSSPPKEKSSPDDNTTKFTNKILLTIYINA